MISLICEKYNITNYTVNADGSIDVNGNVDLWSKNLTELPLRFNKVTGYFTCSNNNLSQLIDCPRWVGSWFGCVDNRLTSLEFSPDYIGGDFYCYGNQLTDNISDSEIGGGFHTSLEQDGLSVDNYNEWRIMYKRKKILNEFYTRYM